MMRILFALVAMASMAQAFVSVSPKTIATATTTTITELSMAKGDDDFNRWARQSRSAGAEDNLIQMVRPLGLILNEDEQGNVYVETVAPKGNAARSGKVREGDIVTMCSATFGDQMWSCRGVGLSRVLAAIRVRAGPVKLVFESPNQYKKTQELTTKQIQAQADASAAAQKKKDSLLVELEQTEVKLKNKKFLGLF
mmetsp:Transcript_21731/g.28102  ORF Transcript_21731/g.28102 Transcript_21731/m.28102 type:complete len:196 (+) Transcript_21731:99-686(+)